jgi:hypothetical protein
MAAGIIVETIGSQPTLEDSERTANHAQFRGNGKRISRPVLCLPSADPA